MKVENKLQPSDGQMKGFGEQPELGPIFMLNLLKFREIAAYEDAALNTVSGAEAYARYGAAVTEIIGHFGGEVVFNGAVSRLMLGEVEDLWDSVAIAKYPSRQAMLDMMLSPEYQAIHHHRAAGLEGQLNIETLNPNF